MNHINKANKYKLKFKAFRGGIPEHQHSQISNLLPKVPKQYDYFNHVAYLNFTTNKTIDTIPLVDIWKKRIGRNNNVYYINSNTKEISPNVPSNSWYRIETYINRATKERTNILPLENVWIVRKDNDDVWFENIKTGDVQWDAPPDSWIIHYTYINSKTNFASIHMPTADIWIEESDKDDKWYVNKKTNKSEWYPPPNSWVEINIPSFENQNFELYNYQGAGLSENIWPIITKYYNTFGKKISIISKQDKSNIYSIIPMNIGNKIEPILGNGTYTAVYMIKDINSKIRDNTNKYILRIYLRHMDYPEFNMFDYQKVKDEFNIFKEYMAIIYYWGSIYEPGKPIPLSNGGYSFDYNITKIYNTLSYKNVNKLTNKQKLTFLLQNIKMLDILQSKGYIHCDYKLDNVAYDNPETMNVILIDYDISTLQPLVPTNKLISFSRDNMVNTIDVSSTFPPMYISNNLPLRVPLNVFFKLPLYKWDKYSIGGLINIIETLNIKYNFELISIPPELSNGKVKNIGPKHIITYLQLKNTDYDMIPTYKELHNIFTYLKDGGHIV